MRIYSSEMDKTLDEILLLLTPAELNHLRDYLDYLLEEDPDDPSKHVHISDNQHKQEITVAVYHPGKVNHFHPRIVEIISEEK